MPKFLNNIDLNKNELQNAVVQVSSEKPDQPRLGQIFYDSDSNQIQVCIVGYDASASPTQVWQGLASEDVDTDDIFNVGLRIGRDADNMLDFKTADNTIDIYLNGAKDFTFTANTFTAQSGSTIAAQALTATTGTFSGVLKTDSTTNATSTTDGSLQTDGGLSVALDAVIGDDLKLITDGSVVSMGIHSDFTITHDGTTGATLAGNPVNITAGGSSAWITTAGNIVIDSEAGALGLDGHTGVAIAAASGEIDITSGGTIDVNSTGAITIDSSASISIGTAADKPVQIDSTTFALDASGAIAIDGVGLSIDNAGTAANITSTSDGAAEDFTIALAGATNSSLILSSTGTGADALQITASAGGIDISASGAAAGEDIDITASGSSVNITSTENAANAVYLRANGGADETILIHSDQGTGDGSVAIKSDAGGITLTSAASKEIKVGTISGAPISIGHTTSETTVNDNLTVLGDLSVTGTTTTQNTVLIENTVSVLVFEGADDDAHATTLKVVEPTATLSYSLPNLSAGDYFLPAIAGAATDASAAVTAAEFALLDGGSTIGTSAIADGDGIFSNNGGTMMHTTVQTYQTYFDANSVGGGNIVTTGALNAGSITSGFGTINNGDSAITTTGLISGGSLDIDHVVIDGATIGHTDDTDLMTVASGKLTVAGEVQMTTLDIGGTDVTATAAEINLIDGDTARGTTAVGNGDGILTNDGGTMRMTKVETFATYFASANVTAREKVFVLNNSVDGVASSDQTTYTVTHSLSTRNVMVEVIRNGASSGDYATVYTDIKRTTDDVITVVFGSAVTAGDYTVMIQKIG